MMKFFSDEVQQDDSNDVIPDSTQVASLSATSIKDTTKEEVHLALVSGQLSQFGPVQFRIKPDSKQTSLVDINSAEYNPSKDANDAQVIRLELNS